MICAQLNDTFEGTCNCCVCERMCEQSRAWDTADASTHSTGSAYNNNRLYQTQYTSLHMYIRVLTQHDWCCSCCLRDLMILSLKCLRQCHGQGNPGSLLIVSCYMSFSLFVLLLRSQEHSWGLSRQSDFPLVVQHEHTAAVSGAAAAASQRHHAHQIWQTRKDTRVQPEEVPCVRWPERRQNAATFWWVCFC